MPLGTSANFSPLVGLGRFEALRVIGLRVLELQMIYIYIYICIQGLGLRPLRALEHRV